MIQPSSHVTQISIATANLQAHLDSIEKWTRKWRLKINENKSTHITFTLRKGTTPQLYFRNNTIPQAETVKYLGLHFDKRLNWKHHIIKMRKHLNLKRRELYWILGRHSPLSLLNKTLIYKVILNPLKSNDAYICRYAPLTSRRCILYIYSTYISTEYFKHAANSPFFPLKNVVYFIILHCLVPVLFVFYIQSVLCKIQAPKG